MDVHFSGEKAESFHQILTRIHEYPQKINSHLTLSFPFDQYLKAEVGICPCSSDVLYVFLISHIPSGLFTDCLRAGAIAHSP